MNPPEALFLACLVSGVLVPVPEDAPLLLAGLAISRGELSAPVAALIGVTSTLSRDGFLYGLGRLAGPRLHALLEKVIGPQLGRAIDRFEGRSQGQQDGLLFLTRFAVGMRGPLYIVAGLLDISLRRFLVLDVIGLLIHVPLVLALGAYYGEDAATALQGLLTHQQPVVLGLTALVLAAWLRRRVRRARAAR
ncbi:MAG: hypothetical protein EXR69_12410 [Myxococcales bacterium]|nr:hypothetical protein [Myxococcales bacterium]